MKPEPRQTPGVVICDLGLAVALAASGGRIVCDRKPPWLPGRLAQIRLGLSRATLIVEAQARSVRRRGNGGYDLDVEFRESGPVGGRLLNALGSVVGEGDTATRIRAAVVLPDLYRILGLGPDAREADLRAAYRQRTDATQASEAPDRGMDPAFARVREAFEILIDPEQRRAYDEGVAAAA